MAPKRKPVFVPPPEPPAPVTLDSFDFILRPQFLDEIAETKQVDVALFDRMMPRQFLNWPEETWFDQNKLILLMRYHWSTELIDRNWLMRTSSVLPFKADFVWVDKLSNNNLRFYGGWMEAEHYKDLAASNSSSTKAIAGFKRQPAKGEQSIWTGLADFMFWLWSIRNSYSVAAPSGALDFSGESQIGGSSQLPVAPSTSVFGNSMTIVPTQRNLHPLSLSTQQLVDFDPEEIASMTEDQLRRLCLVYKSRLGIMQQSLNTMLPDIAEVAGRQERWFAMFTPQAILHAYLGKFN